MNQNRKPTGIIITIIVLVIIIIVVLMNRNGSSNNGGNSQGNNDQNAPFVSETTKVSGNLSEYQNSELGFSIKYPSSWEKEEANSGVNFIIPIDKNQVSTVATLQANLQVLSGTCAFPPVVTSKDKGTLTAGGKTFDMLSISNTVQGRIYSDRFYSLQKDTVCYMFHFSAIAFNPSNKGLKGSEATQATNNNKAIISTADGQFTDMVKSYTEVVGPQGQDETKAVPLKK